MTSNDAQRQMLTRHGLTEATLKDASPSLRLLYCEMGDIADAPKPEVPDTLTPAAREFLRERGVADAGGLSDGDAEMYRYLQTSPYFNKKPEAVAADAPSIPAPPTRGPMKLDPAKVAGLSGSQRLQLVEAADYIAAVKSGRFNAEPRALEAAELHLAPYLSAA